MFLIYFSSLYIFQFVKCEAIFNRKKKQTTYIAEITFQKAEKYLSEGIKLESTCLLACLLACLLHVNQEILCMILLNNVLPFPTNQAVQLISHGIYFSENFILSLFFWYDFKIQSQIKGGDTLLYLALSVGVW